MPEIVGEFVDRLCTLGMRPQGMMREALNGLYAAARAEAGEPLTLRAARLLMERVRRGDNVLITTGAGIPPWMPYGETDGPPGAAALGRAITLALGATPVFLTEERNLPPLDATVRASGLMPAPAEWIAERPGTGLAALLPFPIDPADARRTARELFERWQPSAVIAIEKLGPNAKGVIHSARGTDWTDQIAKAHELFREAAERDVLTIGIGDAGNEIGFGRILDDVHRVAPFAADCGCPCHGGMATCVATDALIVASVSNWGGYGIAGCLAFLKGDVEIIHDEATEERMLVACCQAGGVDGMTSLNIPYADGISTQANQAFVTLLREIVGNNLKVFERAY